MPDCSTDTAHSTENVRSLPLLPMAGLTHGNRSAVTCHLRCGDACSFTAPNTTDTTYFRDVAAKALSRRGVMGAGAAAAGLGLFGALTSSPAAASGLAARAVAGLAPGLPFTASRPSRPPWTT